MSRVKTPQEKKRLAYEDHVTPAEYPHAFRKGYPKKKAIAERAARRKVRAVLQAEASDEPAGAVARKTVRKWGSITVRESLQHKQEKRKKLAGRKAKKKRSSEAETK